MLPKDNFLPIELKMSVFVTDLLPPMFEMHYSVYNDATLGLFSFTLKI